MSVSESSLQELQAELRWLRYLLIGSLSIVILALAVLNVGSLQLMPQAEKIFEDMLGSNAKLPRITTFVLSYSKAYDGLASKILIMAPAVLACVLLFATRRSYFAIGTSLSVMMFLVLHWLLMFGGLVCAMFPINTSMGSKTP